jgi:mRNA interferase MazF
VKQYEVWWAKLPDPVGTRPVVLLSRGGAYDYLNRLLAVEVTRRERGIPQEIVLGRREGLPSRCVANLDNLRAVPKLSLAKRVGSLKPARVAELKRALGYALGWVELTGA